MSLAVYKTYVAGEVLTASDLNNSFLQIHNNGYDLVFPATEAVDFDGQELILDADLDSSITADTDDQIDFRISANDRFRMLLDSSVPDFRAEWDDAGADTGPFISTYRNSATPAANDFLGRFRFLGEDSAGNTEVYGAIEGKVTTVTSGSEAARIGFYVPVAGAEQHVFRIGQGYLAQLQSNDAGAAAGPEFILWRNSASPADADVLGDLQFGGNDDGANFTVYGAIDAVAEDVTDGTEDGYLRFKVLRGGSTVTSLSPGIRYTTLTTSSGTTAAFTGIPAGARRITFMFTGVSTSGTTDDILIQLGDLGGMEVLSYNSAAAAIDDTAVQDSKAQTTGFLIISAAVIASAAAYSGHFTITHMGGNAWVGSGCALRDGTDEVHYLAGSKTLSAELTQVQFAIGGTPTDAFDAGSVNILVE